MIEPELLTTPIVIYIRNTKNIDEHKQASTTIIMLGQ